MQAFPYEGRDARLALGLGWFSIGLGVAEVVAPRAMARLSGLREDSSTESVVRSLGARGIANGVSILAQPDRARWLWSRVAGDAVDLSFLRTAMSGNESDRRRAVAATAAVVGVTILDIIAAERLGRTGAPRESARRGVRVAHAVTLNRPIEEVYQFWRDFGNFPRFMRHLESVRVLDNRRSRWQARGPARTSVQWDAEIVQDIPDELIAWRSLPGSQVENYGSVQFRRAPGARGTEVRVQLEYYPPAGALGRGIAWLFGEEPDQQIREDLHRFKQLAEAGEIALSEDRESWRQAQPPARREEINTMAGVLR
jgi:uncharacterized membrane protein